MWVIFFNLRSCKFFIIFYKLQPGTGKTTTILSLLRTILTFKINKGKKILICTPSNNAIDEVAVRIIIHNKVNPDKEIKFYRLKHEKAKQ